MQVVVKSTAGKNLGSGGSEGSCSEIGLTKRVEGEWIQSQKMIEG